MQDYVSHISRLPLGGAIPPWKLFVIQLQGGAGGAGCDAARTCLVVKCHRRLSDALDAFIRREETLGRKNDAYSMILYDAALRLDDANDAAAAASVAAAGAPPPTAAGRTKLQSLQLFLVKFKVNLGVEEDFRCSMWLKWAGIAGAAGDVVLDDAVRHQRAQDRPGMFMEGVRDGQSRRHRRLAQRFRWLEAVDADVDAQFTAPLLRSDLQGQRSHVPSGPPVCLLPGHDGSFQTIRYCISFA